MSDNNTVKKRGRPSKGVDNARISVRLSSGQHSVLCGIGHDFYIYPKSSMSVNASEVIQRMLDKAARLKTRFFDERENGILFDNIQTQLIAASHEFYKLADDCKDESQREHYLERGETMAKIAHILEDVNYNDLKPDVTQKMFIFGSEKGTGRFIGVEQERKIDKKFDDNHFGQAIRQRVKNKVRQK